MTWNLLELSLVSSSKYLTFELRVKSKKHSIHRLRWERDRCIAELEVEYRRYRTSLKRVALAKEESSSARANAELAKAEAESVREVLGRAIEDFKNSEKFKEEILEGGFASYCVGYEDSRDAIKKLYPNLDLSTIIPPRLEDGAAEEDTMSAEGRTPTAPKVIQVSEATPEKRDEGDN